MKKLLCFSFVFLLVTNLPYKAPLFYAFAVKQSSAVYSFYVLDELNKSDNYTIINNAGLGSVVRCSARMSKYIKPKLNKIMGESVQFNGSLEAAMFLINFYQARVVKTEWLQDGMMLVYANANLFSQALYLENDWVNLQICYHNGVITIGSPIILGDY
jgi:hypothetical protein